MTDPRDRWQAKHEAEQGAYAQFVGFEEELKAHDDRLAMEYIEMDIYTQIELYDFVTNLLEEAIPKEGSCQ